MNPSNLFDVEVITKRLGPPRIYLTLKQLPNVYGLPLELFDVEVITRCS